MGALGQDLRYALNALRRNVGFTTITVLTLALGVGVNTTVFAVLRAVVLAPLEGLREAWPATSPHAAPRPPIL